MRIISFIVIGALLIFAGYTFGAKNANAPTLGERSAGEIDVLITLEEGLDRKDIVQKIGQALGFDDRKIRQLHDTYRAMQWDAFNDVLAPYLVETYELTEKEREILLTHSTVYLNTENDILESLYVPDNYQFEGTDTVVGIVEKLLAQMQENKDEKVRELLNEGRAEDLVKYLKTETELLPDLVPLPPQDISVKKEGGETLLVFTTVYYNKGDGDLELRADPLTIGVLGDFDRDVHQRIYGSDGTYREQVAGTFEWHYEHFHYHFVDFIEYRLEGIDNDFALQSGELLQKSTFCIRDISRVYLDGELSSSSAKFQICGRERQGVSVGWGDAYFSTYPDQNLNITELPSGTYRLTFIANPADRFLEETKENNTSSAIILYDAEAGTVEVLETEPTDVPEFEHIHIEQG